MKRPIKKKKTNHIYSFENTVCVLCEIRIVRLLEKIQVQTFCFHPLPNMYTTVFIGFILDILNIQSQ